MICLSEVDTEMTSTQKAKTKRVIFVQLVFFALVIGPSGRSCVLIICLSDVDTEKEKEKNWRFFFQLASLL